MKARYKGPVACVVAFIAVASTGLYSRAFTGLASAPNTALLDTLLTYDALLVAVLVGMLGALLAMQQRPLVQRMKNSPKGFFDQLVHRGFRPFVVFLIAGAACIFCLSMIATDPEWLRLVAGSTIYALTAWGIIDTYQFTRLLVLVITDPGFDGAEDPEPERYPTPVRSPS